MPDEAAESSRFRMRDIPAGVSSWMAYTPLGGRSPLGHGLVQLLGRIVECILKCNGQFVCDDDIIADITPP
jgi:hypothetical protein